MPRLATRIAIALSPVGLMLATLPLLTPIAAYAVTDRWASWTPITGTSNNYALSMQQAAPGFPAASVATDSRANVQLPSGASTFQGAGTPPGAEYGSSQGSPYLVLRPRADNATASSTTTYTFDTATPDTGWALVLGDIDADQVQVRALDATGVAVSAVEIDSWFRGAYNSTTGTDIPTWVASTSTLTGNTAAVDTDGATGWFEPDVPVRSLTLVFTRRAGFPVYQTWFVSRARPLGGIVDDVSVTGACPVQSTALTLVSPYGVPLATTSPDATGAYTFGEWATQGGYTVRLGAPATCAILGPGAATLDNRGDDDSPASRADFSVRQVVPQPISGTVTDTEGDPVPGVVVTLTRPDATTSTTTSGADGGYLVDDNPVGTDYTVAVTVPTGYAAGPGGTTITGVAVAGAPVTGQNFVLRALPDVSGRVTGGGGGLGGVPVTLTPGGGGPPSTTVTAGDGTYAFAHVAPGSVTLSVVPPAGYAAAPSRAVTVDSSDVVAQDFALTRPGAVSGAVSDDVGPVPGAVVTIEGPGGPRPTTTDQAGTFVVDGLVAGDYTVVLTPPTGYAVVGAGSRAVTITAAGEVRGGIDFGVVAVAAPPAPSASASATPTAQSPAPSSSPSVDVTTASSTPSPSPSPSLSPTSSDGTDPRSGVLPDTGGPPPWAPGLALALTMSGIAVLWTSRRRRDPT